MYSPEFMKYLIMYQNEEFMSKQNDYKNEKNDETYLKFHRLMKYATVPIKAER